MSGTSAVMVDSTITNCAANRTIGGGIWADRANLTLTGGSHVRHCDAYRGGGVFGSRECDLRLLGGSTLSENVACVGAGMRSGLVAHVCAPRP